MLCQRIIFIVGEAPCRSYSSQEKVILSILKWFAQQSVSVKLRSGNIDQDLAVYGSESSSPKSSKELL